MTAQISDSIFYLNEKYSVIAIENEWPFNPVNHGLNPIATSTACYRGYYCEYSILEEQLVLSKLNIGLNEANLPILNGVEAKKNKYFKVNHFWEYNMVNLPVKYSGGIIIGRDFLRKFYVHMGFHRAHCFKFVIELIIKDGKLVQTNDHSKCMEEVRRIIESNTFSLDNKDIEKFVEDSFSLSYEKKWYY
ncbi:MAG TPA: hypothetical protein VF941_17450 [Clostridia bacterium]